MLKKITLPIIFMALLIVSLTLGMKDNSVCTTSEVDSVISMNSGDELTQTWMPNGHRYTRCTYYFDSDSSPLVDGDKLLLTVSDTNGKVIRSDIKGKIKDSCCNYKMSGMRLDPGKQYTFALKWIGDSCVSIVSSSNGYGAYLNSNDLNSVVCMDMVNSGFRSWAYALVIVLAFSSIAFVLAYVTGRTYSETIGLSFLIVGLVMYLFGIFNRLSWGYIVAIVIGLVAFIFTILCLVLKTDDKMKKIISSPALVIFAILAVFLSIYNRPGVVGLIYGDEFTYWGRAAKDMYYFDSLAVHGNSTIDSNLFRYVPLMPVFQYIFLRIAGVYDDAYLYFAYQLLSYSLMFHIFKNCTKNKNLVCKIVYVVILVAIPMIFSTSFFTYVYIDPFLGIISGYTLCMLLTNRETRFGLLTAGFGAVTMVLTKEMGCVILVCIAIIVAFDILCARKSTIKELLRDKGVQTLVIVCLLGIIAFGSYRVYVNASAKMLAQQVNFEISEEADTLVSDVAGGTNENVEKPAVENISTENVKYDMLTPRKKIANFFKGESEDYQRESFRRMFELMFTDAASGNRFPYVDLMLVMLLISFVWNYKFKGRNYLYITCGAFCGLLLYMIVLFCMYISIFPPADAVRWGSAGRYIDTYVTMYLLAMISLWLDEVSSNYIFVNYEMRYLLVLMGVVLYFAPVDTALINHEVFNKNRNCYENKYFPKLFDNLRTVAKEGDRILYLNMADKEDEIQFGGTMVPFKTGIISDSNEVTFDNIAKYDYVYLEYNPENHPISPELFLEGNPIDSKLLYKVVDDNRLKYIASAQ